MTIHIAYGMTEISSLVTFNHMYHHHKVVSFGTPAGIVEVRVVDDQDNEVPACERFEIVIIGPNIINGYFNQAEETAKVLRNRWLHSSDIGWLDNASPHTNLPREFYL